MHADALDGLVVREPTVDDHRRVLAVMDEWWGGLGGAAGSARRAALVPRLFFEHFTTTSMLLERDGELVGFLVGFLSQSRPDEAYVHFVGVAPELRGSGVGAAVYRRFFALARAAGRTRVRSVTSPVNRGSVAFHRAMGFELEPGEETVDGIPVQRDHDGPGVDLVAFVRRLEP
jgi:ribosomal protein S18 acetylase RimI-like enzyme